MWRDRVGLELALTSLLVLCTTVCASLVAEEKQQLLDLHNYHRASVNAANMRRLSWSSDLERAAQAAAETCDVVDIKGRGTNLFYNMTELPEDSLEIFQQVMGQWQENGENVQQPVLWAKTSLVGCAVVDCPRLPLQNPGQKIGATRVFVCKYTPTFFSQEDGELYREGPCSSSSCPTDVPECVQFGGAVGGVGSGGSYCAIDDSNPQVPEDSITNPVDRAMTRVSPQVGSVAGGNHITITGRGFSSNQYNGGNRVVFMNDNLGNLTCDVISYRTSQFQIECVTREAPVQDSDTTYTVMVYANDGSGKGFEPISSCGGCTFRYDVGGSTTNLRNLSPLASLPGSPVTVIGTFRASGFQDANDPKDPSSTDTDDEGDDYFNRVLVGGRGCNHMTEDGGMYRSSIDDIGIVSTLECLPPLDDIIDSHNVSVFLERRGMSYVDPGDHLVGLDNKLRPYHFQTYADVLEVTPRRGSQMGGTRISVTVSNSLLEYEEDVQVFVGGLPCTQIAVFPNQTVYDGNGVIQCTTPATPPPSTYYPGGRGTLREVWFTTDLGAVENSGRSENSVIHERLFLWSYLTSPDFGEEFNFAQRFSGFFVPPKASLYTFNLRSDDLSRLFLSPNTSKEHAELIINNPRFTAFSWDLLDHQFSEPIYLTAGQHYYFEVTANQYGGPWDVGLGVKLHDSELSGGLYDTDKEEQRISISSSTVQERHAVSLEVRPAVQRVLIESVNIGGAEAGSGCSVTLDLSRGGDSISFISISPFVEAEEVEELLNNMEALQNIARVSVQDYTSDNSTTEFTIVYLSYVEVTAADLVTLGVSSDNSRQFCTQSNATLEFLVEVETVQTLTAPSSFQVGFNVNSQQQRLTRPLPLTATNDMLRSELTELLSWGCKEDEGLDQRTSFYQDYETAGMGRNRENDTSFCGSYSNRNPRVVWRSPNDGDAYRINSMPYVCFAYRGAFPLLALTLEYREIESNPDNPTRTFVERSRNFHMNSQRCSSWPFTGTFSSDGWSEYACVNIRECVNEMLVPPSEFITYDSLTVQRIWFSYREDFNIDNFALASTTIQVSRIEDQFPARPNDVVISYMEVDKETLPYPELIERTDKEEESSGFGPDSVEYSMVVSRYEVSYSVLDCGFGIGLLVGSYADNGEDISVEQVQEASRPVSGEFHISIGDKYLRGVDSDVTEENLEELLNLAFPDEGGFNVDRSGSCSGYTWDVEWDTKTGDQPLMSVDGGDLRGDEVEISMETLVDGGLWIRPLRGDMLRLPETEPQVEVIVNGIPSSCTSGNCSFTFDESLTPAISSLFPTMGQSGTNVTIRGQGFSGSAENLQVLIGGSECAITYSSATELHCNAGLQSAGCYRIQVTVEGMGMAYTNDSLCFQYLLTVDDLLPKRGGVMGGHVITFTGEGFMEFVRTPREELEEPFSLLPWFRFGVGTPYGGDVTELLQRASEDPSLGSLEDGSFDVEVLKTHLADVYANFSSFVFVGSSPCIIIQSSIRELSCVPLSDRPGSQDVTVTVWNQYVTLQGEYTISSAKTVKVTSITPSMGPVTGGRTVVITGSAFGSDLSSGQGELGSGIIMGMEESVEVLIGSSFCDIQWYSNIEIQCTTSLHQPGSVLVLVSTAAGVAVMESVLMGTDVLPTFMYRLQITDVSSSGGSVFGGTEVTLSGGAFVEGETEVMLGMEQAEIVSVSMNEVTFLTPSSIRDRLIKLSARPVVMGSLSIVSYQFDWSVNEINITVGDSVTWDWELDLPVDQQLQIDIYETVPSSSNPDILIARTDGFSNVGATSESDKFTITFNEVGTHYFVTEDSFNREMMYGVVRVSEPQAIRRPIEVYVGGFLAEYVSSRRRRLAEEGYACVDQIAEDTSSQDVPSFDYSPCLTPTVFSVIPWMGTRRDMVFTISGEGFSTTSNVVTFGDTPCEIETNTENTITCRLSSDMTYNPPAFTPLSISLLNTDNGYAYIQTPGNATVTLYPLISEIMPSEGSTAGGTDIIILGDTFSFDQDSLIVRIGGIACDITSVQYSEIRCQTGASVMGALVADVQLYYGEEEDEMFIQTVCGRDMGCSFNYSENHTPRVESVTPSTIRDPGGSTLYITGWGFSDTLDENVVYVGDYACEIESANETLIICDIPALSAGTYSLSLKICNLTDDRCFGYAAIADGAPGEVTVETALTGIAPRNGSVLGGTAVDISGYGFDVAAPISVTIGDVPCAVRMTSLDSIICVTGSSMTAVSPVVVTIDGFVVSHSGVPIEFEYTMEATPIVTTIAPMNGQPSDMVTLTGERFGMNADLVEVFIGGEPCAVQEVTDTEISCEVGINFGGDHAVEVTVTGEGSAMVSDGVTFTYNLVIISLSDTSGSIAGQNTLRVSGSGFDPSDTTIMICDNVCTPTATIPSATEIECLVPPASIAAENDSLQCTVTVESAGSTVSHSEQYTYQRDLTPRVTSINDTRGGTAGGTRLSISGSGFTGTATVTIAGSPCIVEDQAENRIDCVTEGSGRTVRARVMVFIEGKGFALSEVEFWYVDLWSSRFTWGNGPLPAEGDFVVVPNGQTLVLDVKTPILSYLLIQGGELIFDREKGDNEVELHTQGALITSGGRLEVGTEDEPFLSKTQIVLYGHVLSTEIPVYGAKTLALREGEIDLHGRPLNVTWTRLAQTADPGDIMIYLQDWVEWEEGGKIVLASTSFSQRENEEMEIASIESGEMGSILTLTAPLEYEHISVQQEIAGRVIETRGEVGYLTRNVVVRGNVNEEWNTLVEDCPEEFRPGQFEVQTCFQGRFGAEIVGDQFGSQIMIHGPEQNQGLVTGRIEYIEVTHAGQAFRLGRYPIHFHLNGDVSGSYVRGCGIHHTFNRAVTIHAVDHLLVEKNVAFNILGHAYFLEDGIEQFNIIQDNLGVFVRASSSLLNVDITPATFWVVNANNIVRRNAAAGGTHFGFWYRLPANPTGPSFTPNVCPRKQRVLEFSDNTAHSFGWYGLWVFRQYFPSPSGSCNDPGHAPSYYDNFLAWRNDRGVEFAEVGALQLRNSVMLDNTLAGVEITELESMWGDNGTLISNTLIVGYSDISASDFCSESGIKTPKSFYLTVAGVTFANFDRVGCYPIRSCSHCKVMQGGFETRYRDITFVNAGDRITRWQWEHEHSHRDLDGTLTGSNSPKLLIPTNRLLDPTKCSHHIASSDGGVAPQNGTLGSICDGDVKFGRLAVFDPTPSSLEFTSINVTSAHGVVTLPYVFKRLRGTGPGYMAMLELNQTYDLTWLEGLTFTNISYSSLISGFGFDDYLLLRQTYPQSLDFAQVAGVTTAVNATVLDEPASASTGDYAINSGNQLTYIIKGGEFDLNEDRNTYSTYRCFYLDCIPPPPPTLPPPIPTGRPENIMMWSNTSMWPNEVLPAEGDNVTIPQGAYVLVDVPSLPRLGTLMIEGGLELLDDRDRTLEANLIIINGGRLAAGYPETPFRHNLRIILHGSNTSPEVLGFEFGSPNVGAKAIAVFGELILNAEPQDTKTWTMLSETATAGTNQIALIESVEWRAGDLVVITSTSFDAFETEVFEVTSVQGNMLVLNDTLQYTHLSEDVTIGAARYTIRAEVGRLTRSIVIENGESDLANEQAFGCRVLVTNAGDYFSSVQLQGVEFKGCGQLGYTDTFDPRFALAVVNVGTLMDSYVRECTFHDGFNTAIGVFGTDALEVVDNVIHSTVGPSMILDGSDHEVLRNLASLSQFLGTFRDRDEQFNDLWTANFEIAGASRITFTHNHAAGGAKAGVHTDGEDCTDSLSTIQHNVAHSSLHGFHVGYNDGSSTLCSKFVNMTAYSCYQYGFFIFSRSAVEVYDSTFVNNKAGIYASVIGPNALSHQISTKDVLIEKTNIFSAGISFECEDDNKRPEIANHMRSHFGLQTPTGGHVGVLMPTFVSGRSGFPKFPWHALHSYPAIRGLTTLRSVTFVNFANRCGNERDSVLMTNNLSEDANHPVYLEGITFDSDARFEADGQKIQPQSKVFIHMPDISSINPSDCVDMDCDGLKHILIKDLDGSFTEQDGPRTLVSLAELEWDGDRRRGIGDFRIPKTMLSNTDGSRIPIDDIYPAKGVLRGSNFGEDQCVYNEDWTLYECADLDHLMLVLESLDEDTEVRRLSPIGIGANGFIDLLNGPMDNGWCGGYTCQERISTFYGIVASSFIYTIGLTSTNPQNFAIHLLNSNDEQAFVMRIIYTNPQRLDVYINENGQDVYVPPKNAELLEDGNLEYRELDPNLGDDQFFPLTSDAHGANFYDRSLKQLHVNIRGSNTYKIITTPVIMLSLTISTTVDGFFEEEFLVRNLALLLNIPDNRIRIVNVVRESRRRRQTDTGAMTEIEMEIGDPPATVIETPANMNDTVSNDTNTGMNVTNTANTTDSFSFDQLNELTEMVAAIVQTGEILNGSDAEVVSAAIEEPEPPPVDPTGGVRATPSTGGPQPEDIGENSTVLTFFEQQQMQEEIAANTSQPTVILSIPSRLYVTRQPSATGAVEGLPLPNDVAPIITVLDRNDEVSKNLGVDMPWRVTGSITTGPEGAFLSYETVDVVNGHAVFEGMVFSHPGMYTLQFMVTTPSTNSFSISTQTLYVETRSLSLNVYQQPLDGNTTFTLYPYPVVQLFDEGLFLDDHLWRNSTWFVTAYLLKGDDRESTELSWRSDLVSGVASFPNIRIPNTSDYRLEFQAHTLPVVSAEYLPSSVISDKFTIRAPQFTRFIITYDVDFAIVVNMTNEFIRAFEETFLENYPGSEIYNTTISEGSIVVSTFVTAPSARTLVDIINQVTTDPNTTLSFVFGVGGVLLIPSTVIQDPAFPVSIEDHLVLILVTTIPAGVILLCGLLLICMVCWCQQKRRNKDEFKIKVSPGYKDTYVNYGSNPRLLEGENFSSTSPNEYFLEEHEMGEVSSPSSSTPQSQRKEDWVTSSEKVEVSVLHSYVVENPLASVEEEEITKEDLGNMI